MTFFDEYHAGHVDRAYDVSSNNSKQRLKVSRVFLTGANVSPTLPGDGAAKAAPAQSGERGGEGGGFQELQRRGAFDIGSLTEK